MTIAGPRQDKQRWEELVTAASQERDPEKLADIVENLFAALEERERNLAASKTIETGSY